MNIKKPKGFSLIELMIVISIISVIAVLGISVSDQFIARAKQSEAKVNLKSIWSLLKAYDESSALSAFPPSQCLSSKDVSGEDTCNNNNNLGFSLTNCQKVRYIYLGLNAFEFETAGERTVYRSSCGTIDAWSIRTGSLTKIFDSTRDTCRNVSTELINDIFANYGGNNPESDFNGDHKVNLIDFNMISNVFAGGGC